MKSIILFCLLGTIMLLSACDNIDVSSMSDEDLQRIAKTAIVCDDPYIRHGSDCCLDRDSNKICDEDENIQSQRKGELPSEFEKENKDEVYCFERGGSGNYYKPGQIYVKAEKDGREVILQDKCINSKTLEEYSCDDLTPVTEIIECSEGCINDACVPEEIQKEEEGWEFKNGVLQGHRGSCESFNLKILQDEQLNHEDYTASITSVEYKCEDGEDYDYMQFILVDPMSVTPKDYVKQYFKEAKEKNPELEMQTTENPNVGPGVVVGQITDEIVLSAWHDDGNAYFILMQDLELLGEEAYTEYEAMIDGYFEKYPSTVENAEEYFP